MPRLFPNQIKIDDRYLLFDIGLRIEGVKVDLTEGGFSRARREAIAGAAVVLHSRKECERFNTIFLVEDNDVLPANSFYASFITRSTYPFTRLLSTFGAISLHYQYYSTRSRSNYIFDATSIQAYVALWYNYDMKAIELAPVLGDTSFVKILTPLLI